MNRERADNLLSLLLQNPPDLVVKSFSHKVWAALRRIKPGMDNVMELRHEEIMDAFLESLDDPRWRLPEKEQCAAASKARTN